MGIPHSSWPEGVGALLGQCTGGASAGHRHKGFDGIIMLVGAVAVVTEIFISRPFQCRGSAGRHDNRRLTTYHHCTFGAGVGNNPVRIVAIGAGYFTPVGALFVVIVLHAMGKACPVIPKSAGIVFPFAVIGPNNALDLRVIADILANTETDGVLMFVNSAVPHVTAMA